MCVSSDEEHRQVIWHMNQLSVWCSFTEHCNQQSQGGPVWLSISLELPCCVCVCAICLGFQPRFVTKSEFARKIIGGSNGCHVSW